MYVDPLLHGNLLVSFGSLFQRIECHELCGAAGRFRLGLQLFGGAAPPLLKPGEATAELFGIVLEHDVCGPGAQWYQVLAVVIFLEPVFHAICPVAGGAVHAQGLWRVDESLTFWI